MVFSEHVMKQRLPSDTYKKLSKTIKEGKPLDLDVDVYKRQVLCRTRDAAGVFGEPDEVVPEAVNYMDVSPRQRCV